jgi:arylformamidase
VSASQGPVAALLAALDGLTVYDVSPTIDAQLPMFFRHESPVVAPVVRHDQGGVAVNSLSLNEHTGTHIDAPFHFAPHGQTIDEIDVGSLLLRPYCKYDLSADRHQPGALIELDHLKAAEGVAGFTLQPGDVAIVEVGWDRNLPGGPGGRDGGWWGRNQPGLSAEACDYLANARVSAVASDTAACDVALLDGQITAAHGHASAFLPRGILIAEGLTGLAAVPSTGLFLALPLKIAGGTASPVRIVLLADRGLVRSHRTVP